MKQIIVAAFYGLVLFGLSACRSRGEGVAIARGAGDVGMKQIRCNLDLLTAKSVDTLKGIGAPGSQLSEITRMTIDVPQDRESDGRTQYPSSSIIRLGKESNLNGDVKFASAFDRYDRWGRLAEISAAISEDANSPKIQIAVFLYDEESGHVVLTEFDGSNADKPVAKSRINIICPAGDKKD